LNLSRLIIYYLRFLTSRRKSFLSKFKALKMLLDSYLKQSEQIGWSFRFASSPFIFVINV